MQQVRLYQRERGTFATHVYSLLLRPSISPLPSFSSRSNTPGLGQGLGTVFPLDSDPEQRLIPRVIQLVRSPDGHRICLGNWSTT